MPLLVAGLVSIPAHAQEFRGVVLDSAGLVLRDAQVTLIDTTDKIAGLVRSNARGEFRVRAPDAGFYGLQVRRLGYLPRNTTWLEVDKDEVFSFDVVLAPAPTTLTAVTVRAQRDTISRRTVMGMNLRAIAGSILTPVEIESRAAGARNIVDVIRSIGPAWVTSIETPDGDCVSTRRGGAGGNACLLVLVDGVRVEPAGSIADVATLDAVDHVIFLRATDAGALFGTGAHNGVLLVYTKRGVERLKN